MTNLVRAKSAIRGSTVEFLVDRRLVEKYPSDYKVIKKTPPTPKNEAGVVLTD